MYISSTDNFKRNFLNKNLKENQHMLNLHKDIVKCTMENKNAKISEEFMEDTINYISEYFNLVLSESELNDMLDIFPLVRISIALNGCQGSNGGIVSDMIMNFFLGVNHPKFGDKFSEQELSDFYSIFYKQARKFGYTII